MAKSKYNPDTFPILVEGYAREGMVEADMAKKLGISKSTFEIYKVKYPDFLDSLKRGKAPVDFEVENALLKRALGGIYEDSTTEDKLVSGQKITLKKTIIKQLPPDVAACVFWLKNRKPDKWRDRVPEGGSNPDDMTEVLKDFGELITQGDLDG